MNDREEMQMQAERLISRVVDGEATQSEWRTFCDMADADPLMWRELAEAQQQHAELTVHLTEAVAAADQVEAPVDDAIVYRFNQRLRAVIMVGGWSGWVAAAAAVLVAWSVGLPGGSAPAAPQNGSAVVQAGVGGGLADALQTYLDRGRESGKVVGELPERILLDARPLGGSRDAGRYEVIYLRQIMERAVVDELYGVGTDDAGRPAPVRIHVAPTIQNIAPLFIHTGRWFLPETRAGRR